MLMLLIHGYQGTEYQGTIQHHWVFSGSLDSEESACNAGDLGLIPGLGRSPGEGNGNPLTILAWEIPWTEEPERLLSLGSQTVGRNFLFLTKLKS